MKKLYLFFAITLYILVSLPAQALTVTVKSDSDADVTLDAFCSSQNYQNTVPDPQAQGINALTAQQVPNPESKIDFAQRKVKEFIFQSAQASYVNSGLDQKRKDLITEANSAFNVKTGVDK